MDINISELNGFDITVISVIFVSTLFAFFRGFIKAAFSLATWVGAATLAVYFYPNAHDFMEGKINNEKALIAVCTIGVFTVLFIIIAYINSKFVYMLRSVRGGAIDRTLGFAFGFARGVLIVSLAFFSINMTSTLLKLGTTEKPGPEWFANAKTYNALRMFTESSMEYLPEDTPERLAKYVDKFKAMTENAIGSSTPERALNPDELAIMKKVMTALPKGELQNIYNKYDGNTSGLSEAERMKIFSEILSIYNSAAVEGKIEKGLIVSRSEINTLDKAVNGSKVENIPEEQPVEEVKTHDEVGYKEFNMKQMDRLIDNVEEGEKKE